MKSLDERLDECTRIRAQWNDATCVPFPAVPEMNEFIRGHAVSGKVRRFGRTISYQFSTRDGTESFVKVSASAEAEAL
jgi:hypothetical protein